MESLDTGTDTTPGMELPDSTAPSPDREFDRKWAFTLLNRALDALAEQQKAVGKADHFDTLKPWLTGDTESLSQAEAARRLGLNEGAVKVAIHRLRRHFRAVLKAEIAQTVRDHVLVEGELQHLLRALLDEP